MSHPISATHHPSAVSVGPHLETALSRLPKSLFTEHRTLMRTAVARCWANSALSSRQTHQIGRAIVSLFYAVWWDYKWRRRGQLIWSFCRGNKRVLASYKTKLWRSQKENHQKKMLAWIFIAVTTTEATEAPLGGCDQDQHFRVSESARPRIGRVVRPTPRSPLLAGGLACTQPFGLPDT